MVENEGTKPLMGQLFAMHGRSAYRTTAGDSSVFIHPDHQQKKNR